MSKCQVCKDNEAQEHYRSYGLKLCTLCYLRITEIVDGRIMEKEHPELIQYIKDYVP